MRVVHISTIHRALDVRIFYKECKTLAAAGHEVHLIVSSPPSDWVDGVFFHRVDRTLNANRIQRTWRRLSSAYQQAISLKSELYHFHDPELIPIGILLKLTGAKVIYDVHEDSPQEAMSLNKGRPLQGWIRFWIWTVLEGLAKRVLDAFVCVTPTIAQNFPEKKTILVHNYPLLEELLLVNESTIPYCARNPNIAYVGGISAIRAIREMVSAMEHLPTTVEAKMVLVGEFSPPELKAEVEQMSGWERVEFMGWQSRSIVIQQLAQARLGLVLFHPERDHIEALPNKLFEYMAAGLPIVASDFPLWREIIESLGCGLLVDPLDPRAIAQAIQYLLEHPDLAEAMGKRGQEAVQTKYNWNSEAKKLLELYSSLLSAR